MAEAESLRRPSHDALLPRTRQPNGPALRFDGPRPLILTGIVPGRKGVVRRGSTHPDAAPYRHEFQPQRHQLLDFAKGPARPVDASSLGERGVAVGRVELAVGYRRRLLLHASCVESRFRDECHQACPCAAAPAALEIVAFSPRKTLIGPLIQVRVLITLMMVLHHLPVTQTTPESDILK